MQVLQILGRVVWHHVITDMESVHIVEHNIAVIHLQINIVLDVDLLLNQHVMLVGHVKIL